MSEGTLLKKLKREKGKNKILECLRLYLGNATIFVASAFGSDNVPIIICSGESPA